MNVRLTQIDGKLPNLALMKLAAFHRERGDTIHFTRSPYRDFLEPAYDRVYGSAIFSFSVNRVEVLKHQFPGAVVGGTYCEDPVTVEMFTGTYRDLDYSLYPDFDASLGFATRGCRLKCGFCVVPRKEGKPQANSTIDDIWRGGGYPKHLHLLDNDFFGHPTWRQHIQDIREGGFKVCFNQGINVRMIDAEVAEALASVSYYDDSFKTRRLYTAWDSIGDESRFFRGVDLLADAGIPPTHLLAYMLVGYDPRETWERVFYRFEKMVALGIRPYPMVYGDRHRLLPLGGCNRPIARRSLAEFQRWVIRRGYVVEPFERYDVNVKGHNGAPNYELAV